MKNNFDLILKEETKEKSKYFIVFSIAGKRFAISIENVIEIINLPEIETSLVMPENIIGIFNYNGLMIKVIDLCGFLGLQRENFSINNKLIVTMVEGNCFAIHVSQLEDIVPFDINMIQEIPYYLENSILSEIYKTEYDNINIIDLKLLDSLVSSKKVKAGNFDYSTLLPSDEKSKQVLKIRNEQSKKFQDSVSYPNNITLVHQYILFTLDGFNYYLDLKYVKEFISLKRQKITPLPYTCDYIKGLINYRGNFLMVVDLKRFLNKNITQENEGNKLIIVESKNFDLAFLVDDIKYIKNLKNISKTLTNDSNSPYIYAEFIENNTLFSILNFEKIIHDEKLYVNIE